MPGQWADPRRVCLQTEWTSNEADQDNLFGSPKPEGAGAAVIPRSTKGDENDPLGLMRGGVLA